VKTSLNLKVCAFHYRRKKQGRGSSNLGVEKVVLRVMLETCRTILYSIIHTGIRRLSSRLHCQPTRRTPRHSHASILAWKPANTHLATPSSSQPSSAHGINL